MKYLGIVWFCLVVSLYLSIMYWLCFILWYENIWLSFDIVWKYMKILGIVSLYLFFLINLYLISLYIDWLCSYAIIKKYFFMSFYIYLFSLIVNFIKHFNYFNDY